RFGWTMSGECPSFSKLTALLASRDDEAVTAEEAIDLIVRQAPLRLDLLSANAPNPELPHPRARKARHAPPRRRAPPPLPQRHEAEAEGHPAQPGGESGHRPREGGPIELRIDRQDLEGAEYPFHPPQRKGDRGQGPEHRRDLRRDSAPGDAHV